MCTLDLVNVTNGFTIKPICSGKIIFFREIIAVKVSNMYTFNVLKNYIIISESSERQAYFYSLVGDLLYYTLGQQ